MFLRPQEYPLHNADLRKEMMTEGGTHMGIPIVGARVFLSMRTMEGEGLACGALAPRRLP